MRKGQGPEPDVQEGLFSPRLPGDPARCWPEAAPASGKDGAERGSLRGESPAAEKRPPLSAGGSGRCRRHTPSGLAGPRGQFTQPLCDNLQGLTHQVPERAGPSKGRHEDPYTSSRRKRPGRACRPTPGDIASACVWAAE